MKKYFINCHNEIREKISLILQHGSSLPVSKHTHIFRNNSTGDSRNAQKQTTCSKLGPLASLGFLQKMLKLAKTFHTPPLDWLYIQDLQLWDNFINKQITIKMLHILTE